MVDPELGINVVDLGLIYALDIAGHATVTVDMTLTSATYPLTDVIEEQAETALTGGPKPLASALKINWSGCRRGAGQDHRRRARAAASAGRQRLSYGSGGRYTRDHL